MTYCYSFINMIIKDIIIKLKYVKVILLVNNNLQTWLKKGYN